MTDRDELARDIARHFDHIFGKPETKPLRHDYLLADAILAAGWVKGREEWGVRWWRGPEPGGSFRFRNREAAEEYRQAKNGSGIVRRTVADWEEA